MSDPIYIIYFTRGEYDDYGVGGVMVGPVDPLPVLDAHVAAVTCGFWTEWEKEPLSRFGTEETKSRYAARASAKEALKAAGFREAKALEVWEG